MWFYKTVIYKNIRHIFIEVYVQYKKEQILDIHRRNMYFTTCIG